MIRKISNYIWFISRSWQSTLNRFRFYSFLFACFLRFNCISSQLQDFFSLRLRGWTHLWLYFHVYIVIAVHLIYVYCNNLLKINNIKTAVIVLCIFRWFRFKSQPFDMRVNYILYSYLLLHHLLCFKQRRISHHDNAIRLPVGNCHFCQKNQKGKETPES